MAADIRVTIVISEEEWGMVCTLAAASDCTPRKWLAERAEHWKYTLASDYEEYMAEHKEDLK